MTHCIVRGRFPNVCACACRFHSFTQNPLTFICQPAYGGTHLSLESDRAQAREAEDEGDAQAYLIRAPAAKQSSSRAILAGPPGRSRLVPTAAASEHLPLPAARTSSKESASVLRPTQPGFPSWGDLLECANGSLFPTDNILASLCSRSHPVGFAWGRQGPEQSHGGELGSAAPEGELQPQQVIEASSSAAVLLSLVPRLHCSIHYHPCLICLPLHHRKAMFQILLESGLMKLMKQMMPLFLSLQQR